MIVVNRQGGHKKRLKDFSPGDGFTYAPGDDEIYLVIAVGAEENPENGLLSFPECVVQDLDDPEEHEGYKVDLVLTVG